MTGVEFTELEENLITLQYMQEDYGQMVDEAIDHVLLLVRRLQESGQDGLALLASRMYVKADRWEQWKTWAMQNHEEAKD